MSEIVSETLREVTTSLDDGQYRIVSTLKEGRLYLAEKAGKRFVLKTDKGAKGLELLKREYEMSIGLSHPSLTYVFTWEDVFPVGPCIVQEYVDGRALDDYLAESPSSKELHRVFDELLSVVGYLHCKGVVHNDLKPENILISRVDDRIKLIDLGFADNGLHLSHSLGGTRGYASPELLAGGAVDARSDIYSLGLLLRVLFPDRYRRIVLRCLRKDPARRYESTEAMRRALRRRRHSVHYISLAAFVSLLVWFVLSFLQTRSSLVETQALWTNARDMQASRDSVLADAKITVDAWYETEIPAFREALSSATSSADAYSAWDAFMEKKQLLDKDLPASVPEEIRPIVRNYLYERYNSISYTLQQELRSRASVLR